jgi:hypothetical protein
MYKIWNSGLSQSNLGAFKKHGTNMSLGPERVKIPDTLIKVIFNLEQKIVLVNNIIHWQSLVKRKTKLKLQ